MRTKVDAVLSLTSDGAGLTGTLGAGRDRSSLSPVHSGRAAHSGPGGKPGGGERTVLSTAVLEQRAPRPYPLPQRGGSSQG